MILYTIYCHRSIVSWLRISSKCNWFCFNMSFFNRKTNETRYSCTICIVVQLKRSVKTGLNKRLGQLWLILYCRVPVGWDSTEELRGHASGNRQRQNVNDCWKTITLPRESKLTDNAAWFFLNIDKCLYVNVNAI